MTTNRTLVGEEVAYTTDSEMWKYVVPILVPLGVTENLISVVILSRRKFNMMPSRRTLINLSICDSIVLLVGLLRYWSVAMFKVHPNELSSFACKSLSFLVFFTSHSSAALVGLISVERVIAVMTPAWVKVKAVNVDKYGGPIIFFVIALLNLHVLFTSDLMLNPIFNNTLPPPSGLHHNICVSYPEEIAVVVDILDTTLLFYLPFAVILSCNVAIISHMRMSTRRLSSSASQLKKSSTSLRPKQLAIIADTSNANSPLKQVDDSKDTSALPTTENNTTSRKFSIFKMSSILSRQSTRRRTSKRRDTRVTNTLLLVTSMFLICNLPFSIIHVLRTYLETEISLALNQAWLVAYVLVFVNNCLNFPIYIISQPLFRKEVIQICRSSTKGATTPSTRRSGRSIID